MGDAREKVVRVPPEEGETFFLRVPLCWGWATWGRAWKKFRRDTAVFSAFDAAERGRFDFDGTHPYWKQAEGNLAGTMNTWFVFWYACLFKERGLALFPRETMATNIGHDGSGVHCGASSKFDVGLGEGPVRRVQTLARWQRVGMRALFLPDDVRAWIRRGGTVG